MNFVKMEQLLSKRWNTLTSNCRYLKNNYLHATLYNTLDSSIIVQSRCYVLEA